MIAALFAASLAFAQDLAVCDAARRPAGRSESIYVGGRDGWLFRGIADLTVPQPGEVVLGQLTRLDQALRAQGTSFALAVIPPRGLLAADKVDRADPGAAGFDAARLRADWNALIASLAGTGILVPDIAAAAERAGVRHTFHFRRDHHWTPEGARVAAVAVAEAARAAGLDLGDVRYVRENAGTRRVNGTLGQRVAARCALQNPPGEEYPLYRSVAPLTAASLLGEAPIPRVVVAGDSNANKANADYFNFGGSLAEALHADVLNVGIDGGGGNTGLLAWLDSEERRAAAPRLLVWEVSNVNPLWSGHLRQAIPAVKGICATPLAEATTEVRNGAKLLDVPPVDPARVPYLVLEFDRPEIVQFQIRFDTRAGRSVPFTVRRSTRVPNNGRYFVELQPRTVAVGLDAVPVPEGSVRARICAG